MPRGSYPWSKQLGMQPKDVFYQTITANIAYPAQAEGVTAHYIEPFELPIPRGSYLPAGKQMLIEVLDVLFEDRGRKIQNKPVAVGLFTRDPTSLLPKEVHVGNPQVFATTYFFGGDDVDKKFHKVQCEDLRGNGKIVATDRMYFGAWSLYFDSLDPAQNEHPRELSCRIRYRWRMVPVSEYIGIVQSQVD